MWTKHTNYEQATRIPIIVVAPGVGRPGARSAALVETVDIFPTLCELAGLPAPAGQVPQPMDGRSFASVLRRPDSSVRDHVAHAYPRGRGPGPNGGDWLGRAVRTERHRLVEWRKFGAAPETAEFELYDYVADPGETRNLAGEQPEVVKRLRVLLAQQPEPKRPVPPR